MFERLIDRRGRCPSHQQRFGIADAQPYHLVETLDRPNAR